jgi:hypothetical protein
MPINVSHSGASIANTTTQNTANAIRPVTVHAS